MSNFIDLEVVPTDYSDYSIFSLLCSYWGICKELITIRELINIIILEILFLEFQFVVKDFAILKVYYKRSGHQIYRHYTLFY